MTTTEHFRVKQQTGENLFEYVWVERAVPEPEASPEDDCEEAMRRI